MGKPGSFVFPSEEPWEVEAAGKKNPEVPWQQLLRLCTHGDEKALKAVTTNPVRHV